MNNAYLEEVRATALAEAQKAYMVKVYGWMVAGLMSTGLVGGFVASDASLTSSMLDYFWFFVIAEFGLVFALSAFIHKMSVPIAMLAFIG
jgi:FtsH-binding integral membrane protein